jgi:hypothetical protein
MVLATALVFVLASVLVAIAIAGGIVCWRGLYGRLVDDHPYCRRCRYDLTGHDRRPPRCPECGAYLTGLHVVTIGRRRWEPGRTALGVVLVAVSVLSMAGAGGVRTARAAVVSVLSGPSPAASPGSAIATAAQVNPAPAAFARQSPARTDVRALGLAGPGLAFWPGPAETPREDDSLNATNLAVADMGRAGACFADTAVRVNVPRSSLRLSHRCDRVLIALPRIPWRASRESRVGLVLATGRPESGMASLHPMKLRRHAHCSAAVVHSTAAWSIP